MPTNNRLLHTRIRENIETELPSEEVIHHLREHTPQGFTFKASAVNSDDTAFSMLRGDIDITGRVMRWQGTGSNVRLTGHVNIKEPKRPSQFRVTGTILIVFTVIYLTIASMLLQPINFFVAFGIWFLCSGALTFMSLSRFWEDDKMDERWQAQQELANILDTVFYPISEQRVEHDRRVTQEIEQLIQASSKTNSFQNLDL
ncbi:MAG: hypothetical protein AAF846_28460 [Chloroflexota bacterium]